MTVRETSFPVKEYVKVDRSDHTGVNAHKSVTIYCVCSCGEDGKLRWYYFPTKTAARTFIKEDCAGEKPKPDITPMKVGLTATGIAGALNFHVESTCQNEG